MVAAMLGHERAIGVVKVEVTGELLGGGIADEATVAERLIVGEEADGHLRLSVAARNHPTLDAR